MNYVHRIVHTGCLFDGFLFQKSEISRSCGAHSNVPDKRQDKNLPGGMEPNPGPYLDICSVSVELPFSQEL